MRIKADLMCFNCGKKGHLAMNCHPMNEPISRLQRKVVKQPGGSRFQVLPRVVLLGGAGKREECSSKNDKKYLQHKVKKLRFEKKMSKKSDMTSKSLQGSWRAKTKMQCYHCGGKNHIAQKCHTQRRLLSWMEKGKEMEKKVIL